MDIRCPHGYVVTPKNLLGIMVYEHTGADPCALMNVFSTQSNSVLASYAVVGQFELTRVMRAVFRNSDEARIAFFETLESMTSEDKLAEGLLLYIQLTEGAPDEVVGHIVDTFGPTALRNLEMVAPGKFSNLNKGEHANRKMTMLSLTAARVATVVHKMQEQQKTRDSKVERIINQLS